MTWNEYTSHIRAVLTEFGSRGLLIGRMPVRFRLLKEQGSIYTESPHLMFKDGVSVELTEDIRVSFHQMQVEAYKYHYRRAGGYFFRYEKESTEDAIWEPPEHLHVVLNVPHFNAPMMTLEQVLRLIEVNFYQEGRKESLVGKRLEVTI